MTCFSSSFRFTFLVILHNLIPLGTRRTGTLHYGEVLTSELTFDAQLLCYVMYVMDFIYTSTLDLSYKSYEVCNILSTL